MLGTMVTVRNTVRNIEGTDRWTAQCSPNRFACTVVMEVNGSVE